MLDQFVVLGKEGVEAGVVDAFEGDEEVECRAIADEFESVEFWVEA